MTTDGLRRPAPVETIHLYPEERARLLALLGGLTDADWQRETACPGWSVRDIALHLLGDDLGLLARQRDGHAPLAPRPGEPLGAFLARINDEWLVATRRLSARQLLELLRASGEGVHAYYAALDPKAPGERVSWAGPDPAPNWLGVAREYTERWVHQQQIREAVGAPPLDEPRCLGPVLATFARALPVTLAAVEAPAGTTVSLVVDGPAGGAWTVLRDESLVSGSRSQVGLGGWALYAGLPRDAPAATVRMTADTAWRMYTRGIQPAEAERRSTLAGDLALARHVLTAVAIIA